MSNPKGINGTAPRPEHYKSIDRLFKAAGGSVQVAALLGLGQLTVDRWRITGIPIDRWEALTKSYDVTIEELYSLSIAARKAAQKKVKYGTEYYTNPEGR